MGIGLNPFTGQLDLTGGESVPFDQSFSVGEWTLDGSNYELSIPASTHGKGVSPIVQCYVENGADFEMITPDGIFINASGDVTVVVLQTPDLRFDGKIIIK